jgi:hypothetical protein
VAKPKGVKRQAVEGVAGALKDMYDMYGAPFVDNIVRALGNDPEPKVARKAIRAEAERIGKKPLQKREYTPQEQAIYNRFGSKKATEVALQKQVAAAKDTPKSGKLVKGSRDKTNPTIYRDLQREKGPEEVLRVVRKGDQLKRTESGYVGYPRTVTNPAGLGAMRRGMDKNVQEASDAVSFADPEGLGTWYDRARSGMAASNEPYQLQRSLEQHGVYSAGVAPESELGFALKHSNSRALGVPGMAYRGVPERTLDDAVRENRLAELGDKTGEYRDKQDPRLAPPPGVKSLFGVNDFRWAQGMGYTHPDGRPWDEGVGPTMHPVMDAETALMTERANERMMGGRSDWRGEQMQEIPWIYDKAQDLYFRGNSPTARFGGEPIEGMQAALNIANRTPADYFPKHAFSGTYEYVPGFSTGHMSDITDAPYEEKIAYGLPGAWAQAAPEQRARALGLFENMPESVGAGDRDILYSAAGFRQLPTIDTAGMYINSAKVPENQPAKIARALVDYPTGGGREIAPATKDALSVIERFRALNDAQEAAGGNIPNTLASLTGKNAVLLDTGAEAAEAGRQPTGAELSAVRDALGPLAERYGVSATNRGAFVLPYRGADEPVKSLREMDIAALEAAFPGSSAVKAGGTTLYVPGVGKRANNDIVPTTPYTGEATMGLLEEFARNPPELAMNLSESEDVRNALREKYMRDLRRHNELGASYRGDIQNTRQFFAEADWPKVVEMIRKGISPATALAALGYSASSLAAEPNE